MDLQGYGFTRIANEGPILGDHRMDMRFYVGVSLWPPLRILYVIHAHWACLTVAQIGISDLPVSTNLGSFKRNCGAP